MDELERAIEYAENYRMYVILSPATDDGKALEVPSQKSRSLLVRLAERFKLKQHILYEHLNEVARPDGDDWFVGLIDTARDIRQVTSKSILVMPGWNWNRDFSILQRRPFPYDNTIYDVHYYLGGSEVYFRWKELFGKYPVLFGEAGVPGASGERENPNDAIYIDFMIQLVRQNPKMGHYTGFSMQPGNWSTSLLNPNLNPSKRGQLYYDDMQAFPPTDFTK